MGLGEFVRGIFGKKSTEINADELVFEVNESGIVINGKNVDIPCHLSVLTKMLGKPRRFVGKNSENVNFTWDNLGICCYTKGNKVVYCVGVKVNIGVVTMRYDPKKLFSGRLTISGEPWETVMSGGEDLEIGRRLVYGEYSLFSEYASIEKGDKNGCHGAYSGVEIQLPFD